MVCLVPWYAMVISAPSEIVAWLGGGLLFLFLFLFTIPYSSEECIIICSIIMMM